MSLFLFLIAGVLLWFGVDALLLTRHSSPPGQIEKDEMMFGPTHHRPLPERLRQFAKSRYPFATSGSMVFYGLVFIVAGGVVAWFARDAWR